MVKAALKLGPQDAGMRLSRQEFADADFQPPFIYERVRGRLVVMSPAGPEHRRVSRPFRRELGGYWAQHPDIIAELDVEGWLATGPDDDRIPDICVDLAETESEPQVPHSVPDIVFEFVSAERADQERDDVHKRAEYHTAGFREYVIVDRFKQEVLVLTRAEDDFRERVLNPSDVYASPLLPGLEIPLKEVFQD